MKKEKLVIASPECFGNFIICDSVRFRIVDGYGDFVCANEESHSVPDDWEIDCDDIEDNKRVIIKYCREVLNIEVAEYIGQLFC